MTKCLDSGHDSRLPCGSVLKTTCQISETHSRILSFKNTFRYCFRTALLSGGNFQVFVGAQATENCTSTTCTCRHFLCTFRETADDVLIAEKMPFTCLLPLPSHSTIYFACMCPLTVDILQYALLRFHEVKSICLHMPDRFLILQGARLLGQLSGSTYSFSGFLNRRLVWSAGQILLSWLLQALFGLETSPVSLCLQALGRFPFWCCNLLSQALNEGSCAPESTSQKKEVQIWDKSELLIKPHSGHGKQALVLSLTEGQGNWGSFPRSSCVRG